ncbi:DMT family transporter [Pectinatus brassicae]|uniref:Drug/metabolite transporter (DMT)-like permease n=1 Tax=Pectinatus brassicae TaxID=862415 RepID=A0A840ULK3_9FIRM|nr:DMT family transporter [Pectinatus brassicae]MBB5335122.1 drug/metabolite transporter (DMT)-like permease [Pectinatus brassicae]
MNNRLKGFLLICIGTILWGSAGVVSQYLLHDKLFDAQWLTCIRLIAAGIILLFIEKTFYKSNIMPIWHSSMVKNLLMFSIFGMLATQLSYMMTIVYSNAATATILQYLMPIVILCYILFSEKRAPRFKESLCIILAFIGTFLLVTKGNLNALAISHSALFWGLISAFAAAFYTLQPRGMIRKFHTTLIIGWGMFIGGIVLSLFKSPFDFTGICDLPAILALLFVVLGGTVFSFWTYIESTKYLYPTEVGTLASLEPFSSVVLSVVFMNVHLGLPEIIGSILIVGTVFILTKK